MMTAQAQPSSTAWLFFAFLTVASWGVYGICLHTGQVAMGDPVNGRWKAFLFVGIAYFLVAVLAPLTILLIKGATWTLPVKGVVWSLIAGTVGAVGASSPSLSARSKRICGSRTICRRANGSSRPG